MEPSEFDKILRSKLQEEHNLHQEEIERSKPFVWAAIQSKQTVVIPWYYSAAAAAIICLCFSLFFFRLQQQHQSEIQLLSQKVERLKNANSPTKIVQQKNQQLDLLCTEVENLEQNIAQMRAKTQPTVVSNQIVYRVDTVFLSETKYITQSLPPVDSTLEEKPFLAEVSISTEEPGTNQNLTSDLIYPDFESSSPPREARVNKLKINTFLNN